MRAGLGQAGAMTAGPATVRPLVSADDIAALVALNDRCEIDETGEVDHELTDYLRGSVEDYRAFGIDDGEGLAAFAWVELTPGSTGLEGDVRVRPGLDPSFALPLIEQIKASARG